MAINGILTVRRKKKKKTELWGTSVLYSLCEGVWGEGKENLNSCGQQSHYKPL